MDMRMPDAVLASVSALILAAVLFPVGAVLLIPVAMLLMPVIPVFAVVGLATLLMLAGRSKPPGKSSAFPGRRRSSSVPAAARAS
jgi:hypothetical protein